MLYDGLLPGQYVYRLRRMACHHGASASAYVQLPRQGGWGLSDDGHIGHVGGCAA
jgi:hypothetical protein